MKILFYILILLYTCIFSDEITQNLSPKNPWWESSLGIQQIDKIIQELHESMGNIPPEIQKIAIYQIRSNPSDFSPGLSKYIQGKIETAFRAEGRRKVVSPPELKTLTVISTDTSFELSNTIPTIQDLWNLGEQLRIDAFVEGNIAKTEDGDVLLNLKLIKHQSAEVVWSGDFIAGPNKTKPGIFDLKWSFSTPLRSFALDKVEPIDFDGITQLTIRGECSEALIENKRLWYSIFGGFDLNMLPDLDTTAQLRRIYSMHLGVGFNVIILNKSNPDRGYWLSTYLNAEYLKPFSFTGYLPIITLGYKSQLSKHFSIGAGGSLIAGSRYIEGTGTISSTNDVVIRFGMFSYEINLLNYTF